MEGTQLNPVHSCCRLDFETLLHQAIGHDDSTTDDLETFSENPPAPKSILQTLPQYQTTPPTSQSHRNKKRAAARRAAIAKNGHTATHRTVFEHVQLSDPLDTSVDSTTLPSDSSGYSGMRLKEPRETMERAYTLQELIEGGFEVVQWDGREARPIEDNKRRIIGVLAGMPSDAGYIQTVNRTSDMVLRAGMEEPFLPHETRHRRGHFPALAFGISYGGGQQAAQRLAQGTHSELIQTILQDSGVQRIASYGDGMSCPCSTYILGTNDFSAAFQTWAPRLHAYYRNTLQAVMLKTGESSNFSSSAFAATSVNFGPRTCSFKHRDSLNLPFGWCAITALGNFNPETGGHLVLWDLKLAVQFPPGSTILLPSSVLTHSNTSIGKAETRLSLTQYTAGGVFRWMENGCVSEGEMKKKEPAKYDALCSLKKTRFQSGLAMYSTLNELTWIL